MYFLLRRRHVNRGTLTFYHQVACSELCDGKNSAVIILWLPLATFKTVSDGTKMTTRTVILEFFVLSIHYNKFFNGNSPKKEVI